MKKLLAKLQGNTLLYIATVGIALGNMALAAGCSGPFYEPKKPDILKNEK
ncbi:cyclic lactone autoinducer peptide [Enterococcus rotai]